MSNKLSSSIIRWLWWLVKVAIVIAIIGAVVYFVRFQPVAVVQHEVERGPIVSTVMGTGTLEARVKATISPKIAGRIESVLVDQGDNVTEGQLLVRLDDAELTQQVAIADADIQTKQAAIERVKSDVTRAAAVLSQATTNYERVTALNQQNAISRDELDKAAEARSIAESDVARADAALAEAKKALIVAQRNLEFQKTKLSDSQVVAPFNGMIVRRDREPGDVVVPGSPVLMLISTDQLWISSWVDETEMSKLKTGQTANVIFRSEPNSKLPGKLVRLGKETDRETREFVVDVEVLELPENWAVGQRAEVLVETGRKLDVVQIPGNFISRNRGQVGVFVNKNGFVDWQVIEPGIRGKEKVEIISGLEPGQQIVLPSEPRMQLRRGQRIVDQ
jgi:HlyD family secretion protein